MVTWDEDPSFKIESGAVDFSSDGLTVVVHRPENAISRTLITANDFDGKTYVATVDIGNTIKVSLRYGSGAYTQVFEGKTERVGPQLDSKQTVDVVAYGYGRALRNTHCDSNYGLESKNDTLDTPHEIWDDLIANMINKSFGGAATQYAILDTKVAVCANPVINFLQGGYKNNFTMLNDVLTIYQGYRNGLAGMHWFVDENAALFINTLAAHENDATGWPTYWGGGVAPITLVEGVDFLSSMFHKKVTGDFANKVVLYCNLRKPGSDYWTEDSGGAALWGSAACTLSDANGAGPPIEYVVGSHSLKMDKDNVGAPIGDVYYPAAQNAGWDLTKIGSEHAVPTLNFYFMKNNTLAEITSSVRLFTTDNSNDVDYIFFSAWTDPDDEWVHRSLPIGPYWATTEASRRYRWTPFAGGVNWANVNGIGFVVDGDEDALLYIDDLHFSGKIIREAYNSTSIAAYDEFQKILRYDTAVDDTLKATDDTGTAGHLAYGELLRRQASIDSVVGTITTPLAIDALPGQLIHIHSDWNGATYHVDADFRVKEVIHVFAPKPIGARTTWDLTSDVLNTFGVGFNDPHTAYHKALHRDPDMKNLLTTGLDPYVQRLSIDYP